MIQQINDDDHDDDDDDEGDGYGDDDDDDDDGDGDDDDDGDGGDDNDDCRQHLNDQLFKTVSMVAGSTIASRQTEFGIVSCQPGLKDWHLICAL